MTGSYGIFSGEPTAVACLRFTPRAARWAADEEWFPDQQGRWLDDGSYKLSIPYDDPTKLIMDICRYGPDVEVIEPDALRRQLAQKLQAAADQHLE